MSGAILISTVGVMHDCHPNTYHFYMHKFNMLTLALHALRTLNVKYIHMLSALGDLLLYCSIVFTVATVDPCEAMQNKYYVDCYDVYSI